MERDLSEELLDVEKKMLGLMGIVMDLMEITGERLSLLERAVTRLQPMSFEDLVDGKPQQAVGLTQAQVEHLKEIQERVREHREALGDT